MIRDILRMGDPRLFERSKPVESLGTPELVRLLVDMRETMAAANGAGLAAPQIGVGLRVVIFGFEKNVRYPDAEPESLAGYEILTKQPSAPERWLQTARADLAQEYEASHQLEKAKKFRAELAQGEKRPPLVSAKN